MFTRLMPAMACVALLSACASTGDSAAGMPKAATMAASVAAADAAIAAGQPDKAYAHLKSASQAFPADKTPWVRMAQMRFDSKEYGQAIVDAHEALERDPDDTLAHSIAAVSGLRVSSKALGELTRKNKINGDVKSEAQDLAKLLRTSLGQDDLVPTKPKAPVKPRAPATATASAGPAKSPSSSNDPFDALK
ncbi:M48 family metallopeptidase [Massilia sp. Mn16-1_5]|uniref:tetratricopeptide repeat protein n=1 Tax=Massilia sp. Mn16-1_5 TaxID=2079199 RepID=UPI001E3A07CE|nr:tetratricopeptide repeat protein [Massilia sp. Mn16-1_5]